MTESTIKLHNEIKTIINSWDPERLIKVGAPEDEYESEITAIIGSRYRMFGRHSVANVISEIFNYYFNTKSYTQRECEAVGEKVWNMILSVDKFKHLRTIE